MIFIHTNLIQEGEAALFYKHDKKLNGYLIAGIIIAPNLKAKIDFAKIWTYFVSDVVRADDIYCSLVPGIENSFIDNCLEYYDTIKGIKVYKVSNSIRDKYSNYAKHVERAQLRRNKYNAD